MLRLRAPQQLGYSFDEFTSDVWGGAKKIVTTPLKLAKDVITLDPCGLIRDTMPIDAARDLVKRFGCNPAGRAAMAAALMSTGAGAAVATIGDAAFQMCLCHWVNPAQNPAPAPVQLPASQVPPNLQQYAAQSQPIYTRPIFWIGVAAAVAGLLATTSKKSSKSASAPAPATAPVVVNVNSKDEEE